MSAEETEPVESQPSAEAGKPEETAQPVDEAAPAGEPEAKGEPEDKLPPVGVEVEDVGPLRKKVKITVPAERIQAKRDESLKQLSEKTPVPGFRVGRAPRRLIEKRFAPELKQDIKASMIALGYKEALDKAKLKVIAEPELDDKKFDAIELPESGPMVFDFEVEVEPEFELPPLEGIPVVAARAEITDARVDDLAMRTRARFATWEIVDGPARLHDVLTADMTFQVEGQDKVERPNVQVAARPQAVEGIPAEDLGEKLVGAKAGQTASVELAVPQGHPNEAWRGKKAAVAYAVKQVKRMRLPEVDAAFLGRLGLASEEEFRRELRQRLEMESQQMERRAMRDQVYDYLLSSVELQLPEGALSRMKDRTLLRQANDMMMRGVPQAEIEKRIDDMAVHAGAEAERELKTFFIMHKVAEQLKVDVTQSDVNDVIAQIAARYNRRPDSVRSQLERDDGKGLQQLALQIRESKAVDQLLMAAAIKSADDEKAEAPAEENPARPGASPAPK